MKNLPSINQYKIERGEIPGTYSLKYPCNHQWEKEGRILESGNLFKCIRCGGIVEEFIRNWKSGKNLIKHPILKGKDFPKKIKEMDWDLLEIYIGDFIVTKNGIVKKITAQEMTALKYEDIYRHATEEEILEFRGISKEEYLAEKIVLDIRILIEESIENPKDVIKKIKDKISEFNTSVKNLKKKKNENRRN